MANLTSRINEVVGGGGGLTVVFQTTDFTAEAGNIYRCTDTVTAIQMPTIADGDRIVISPSEDAEWSSNGIVVTPFSGQSIDSDAADTVYNLNMSGVDKVEFTGKLSTTNWEVDTPITPTETSETAIVGAWESYTPTVTNNFPTGKTILFKKMRVGSNLYVRYQISSGGVSGGAGQMQFDLPTGLTADSSQITVANGPGGFFGHGAWDQGAIDKPCVGAWVSSTRIAMYKLEDGVNQALNGGSIQTRPSTFESGPIPIAEWSGSGVTNFLTDNVTTANSRIRLKVGTQTATVTPIDFDTVDYNEGGGFTHDGTGIVTCNFDGVIHSTVEVINPLNDTASGARLETRRNSIGQDAGVGGNSSLGLASSTTFSVSNGDVLEVRALSYGGKDTSIASYWSLTRVADFSAGDAVGFGLADATTAGLVKASAVEEYRASGTSTFTNVIPTYATEIKNTSGSLMTISNSGGFSATANEACLMTMTVSARSSSASQSAGITLNSGQLSTSIEGVTDADRVGMDKSAGTA